MTLLPYFHFLYQPTNKQQQLQPLSNKMLTSNNNSINNSFDNTVTAKQQQPKKKLSLCLRSRKNGSDNDSTTSAPLKSCLMSSKTQQGKKHIQFAKFNEVRTMQTILILEEDEPVRILDPKNFKDNRAPSEGHIR